MDSMNAKGKALPLTKPKKKMKRRGPRLTGVSRQRRLANARERNRVQILNAKIDTLRDLIPLFPDEKRPSKTDTVRLAAEYIGHLTEILETTEKLSSLSDSTGTSSIDDFDFDEFPMDFDFSDLTQEPFPDIADFSVEDLFWNDSGF